jgi:hypothetical protein
MRRKKKERNVLNKICEKKATVIWRLLACFIIFGFLLSNSSCDLTTAAEGEQEGEITLTDHLLCKYIDSNGNPIDVTSTFSIDDQVFSYIILTNASVGDEVRWFFHGPQSLSHEVNYTLDWDGCGSTYAELNFRGFDYEQAIGSWNITLYINGEKASVEYFEIGEPLTGLLWWGPIAGFMIIAILTILTILIAAIMIKLIKRKKT